MVRVTPHRQQCHRIQWAVLRRPHPLRHCRTSSLGACQSNLIQFQSRDEEFNTDDSADEDCVNNYCYMFAKFDMPPDFKVTPKPDSQSRMMRWIFLGILHKQKILLRQDKPVQHILPVGRHLLHDTSNIFSALLLKLLLIIRLKYFIQKIWKLECFFFRLWYSTFRAAFGYF